ncbi:MarR family transcriptional regulator [Luteimonas gilva]|uniref:MarR family transcriptional regulator n=1 Tax=Luteimonas gilva TaxID=2572684 RepID=UPI00294FF628|nr:MarR family transcriptional regulator [Luteimonas gilva]
MLDALDPAVADAYAAAGLDYKPRYTPIVRALARHGPMRIKDIAQGSGLSHSAVSQTVSALAAAKWVELKAGADGRERIVHLTRYAVSRMAALERQWEITAMAAASLNDDIGQPLEVVLRKALQVLEEKSFAARLEDARNTAKDGKKKRPATASRS